jgi:hypothetical protein
MGAMKHDVGRIEMRLDIALRMLDEIPSPRADDGLLEQLARSGGDVSGLVLGNLQASEIDRARRTAVERGCEVGTFWGVPFFVEPDYAYQIRFVHAEDG